jgi:hypothetical protein
MIDIEVNIDDAAAKAGINSILDLLGDRTELHEAMGAGIQELVVAHLNGLGSRSPNTGFYGNAALSAEKPGALVANADGATLSITHRGIALRYYGGRVVPTKAGIRALAVPTEHVEITGERRKGPKESGILAFIPNRKGIPGTSGYFVEGKEVTRERNTRRGAKGSPRIVPIPKKEGGKLMFVLRGWTDHKADESVIPTLAELQAAAAEAAEAVIETFNTQS